MKHRTCFLSTITLAFALFVGPAQWANATQILGAKVVLDLTDLTKQTVDLLVDGLTGARGAAVAAQTTCDADSDSASTSFFGDTGLISADAHDTCGRGRAWARNVLNGKVNRAKAEGIASAISVLTWKGDIKWKAVAPIALPDPAKVAHAAIEVNYSIFVGDIDVDLTNLAGGTFDSGYFSVEHYWNGQQSFSGSVQMMDLGLPQFSGDLGAYVGAFDNTSREILASDLVLDNLQFFSDIDYSSFFQTETLDGTLNGVIKTAAVSTGPCPNCEKIPEPGSISLAAIGLIALIPFVRIRRLRFWR